MTFRRKYLILNVGRPTVTDPDAQAIVDGLPKIPTLTEAQAIDTFVIAEKAALNWAGHASIICPVLSDPQNAKWDWLEGFTYTNTGLTHGANGFHIQEGSAAKLQTTELLASLGLAFDNIFTGIYVKNIDNANGAGAARLFRAVDSGVSTHRYEFLIRYDQDATGKTWNWACNSTIPSYIWADPQTDGYFSVARQNSDPTRMVLSKNGVLESSTTNTIQSMLDGVFHIPHSGNAGVSFDLCFTLWSTWLNDAVAHNTNVNNLINAL